MHSLSRTIVTVLLGGLLLFWAAPTMAQDAAWLDGWDYRHPVDVGSPCGSAVGEYQVLITLDGTFAFGDALPDGGDVVVTTDDGTTMIPFWIEAWDPSGGSARIWVKMPAIPAAGTTVYLYYGNPTPPGPTMVEVGPVGPWDKQDQHIIPAGDPGGGNSLLAENMVYDDATGHYWLVFAAYRSGSHVGLCYTDTPDDPTSWVWHGIVVNNANAPHIMYHDGLWYIFYADRSVPAPNPISVDTSSNIGGPYAYAATVLAPEYPWEANRVDEPYVFQRNDGKWVLLYMGDASGPQQIEQVSYATADDILGPYTKYSPDPFIPFGPPGSFDAGTIADAWVVELDGVYYIGYTVSPTQSSPWRTALATTEDWQTLTKHGIILDLGGAGDWDQYNAFRGAVTRIGDTYYFPYTGRQGSYLMGMATMSAYQTFDPYGGPDDVFIFHDEFTGEALDMAKWSVTHSGAGSSVDVSGGIATMTGVPSSYVQMRGDVSVGTGTLMETYAAHLDAGLAPGTIEGNTAAEVGYKEAGLAFNTNVIRIMDWPDLAKYCVNTWSGGANSGYLVTDVDFDTEWRQYRIFRKDDGTVEFDIDAQDAGTYGPTYVPTAPLYPWLMSYSRDGASESRFQVDWVRVRNWCGAEAATAVGALEMPVADITGHVTTGGTGMYGVSVMLFDGLGAMLDATVTDATGYYEFLDNPWGDYVVTIATPLGYAADAEAKSVALAGADATVDFALTPMAIEMTQRGRGYWMHQVNALLRGKGQVHESMADMCAYIDAIRSHFNEHALNPVNVFLVPAFGDDCTVGLEALRDVISPKKQASMADKARAHLTALLLNMVSGKIAQWHEISEDGLTVSQAITFCNDLIGDADVANDEMAKDIAEMINEGMMVPAGWIDPTTPIIAYRVGQEILPTSPQLTQNYPNPFNPSTVIEFALPEAGQVRLEIFNLLGQRVATLIDGQVSAGHHAVSWDAGAKASGVYFYRLETLSFSETKKMVLMK